MKNKKIIIAGGTGFIGQELCNFFGNENEIVVLGRQLKDQSNNLFNEKNVKEEVAKKIRYVKWDGSSSG
jgi:NAD dependent epimerase/dehydratase family enzyme